MTPGWIKVEFVGGPLDGEGEVHPLMNAWRLEVPGHPEGFYRSSVFANPWGESGFIWTPNPK